jgi:hypothetical protein
VDYVGARFGKGADCSSGYLVFPGQFPLNQEEGAFECWFRPGPDLLHGESRCLFCVGDWTAHIALLHGFTVSSFPSMEWRDEVTIVINWSIPSSFGWSPTWTEGEWVHVAVAWDHDGYFIGPSRNVALYVNGEPVASVPFTWSVRSMPSRIQIGGSDVLPTWRLRGAIDNAKMYDCAKTRFDDREREDAPGIVTWNVNLGGATRWNGQGTVTPR